MEEKKSFLERLQSADDNRKRRWLVVSSGVAMVIVVYVWLAYFNFIIQGPGAPSVQPPEGAAPELTFFETVKRGSAILYENLAEKIGLLGSRIRAPKEYLVDPQ